MSNKILLVDDEKDICKLVSTLLVKNGYEVTCANSGEEALNIVRECRPDLVLLDIMMPGMDGFETATRLKAYEETENIPIIMLTVRSDLESKSRSFDLNVADYIVKPFENGDLLAKVKRVLGE